MASGEGSTGRSVPTSHLESVIARLLVATKGLLDGLLKWSQGQVSEEAISSIYVKLGNDFNSAVAAFAKENIGMSELISIPVQLRACLEACLSDEPSPATFEKHLPKVRAIIINLLTGLREKQKLYRESVAARRAKEVAKREAEQQQRHPPAQPLPPAPITPNSALSSRESLRRFVQQAQAASSSATSATAPATTAAAASSSSRGVIQSTRPSSTASSSTAGPSRSHSLTKTLPNEPSRTGRTSLDTGDPMTRQASASSSSTGSRRDFDNSPKAPAPSSAHANGGESSRTAVAAAAANSIRPASLESSASTDEAVAPAESAARLQSLEKLKKSDSLSRRASKRFSAYAIHRITTGGTSPGRGPLSAGGAATDNSSPFGASPSPSKSPAAWSDGSSSNRGTSSPSVGKELLQITAEEQRSLRRAKTEHRSSRLWDRNDVPPLPPLPASFSNKDLRSAPNVIDEEDDDAPEKRELDSSIAAKSPGDFSTSSSADSSFGTAPALSREPSSQSSDGRASVVPSETTTSVPTTRRVSKVSEPSSEPAFPITVYLQLGRDVKKATLAEAPTLTSLRMLFLERFQYTPGQTDFPAIYLRDARAGIQYELEDLSEVVEGSVLSLNIDTVEQVKSHIDAGLLSLSQELKELKTTFAAMRRASVPVFTNTLSPDPHAAPSSPIAGRMLTESSSPRIPRATHARTPSSLSRLDNKAPDLPLPPTTAAAAATETTSTSKAAGGTGSDLTSATVDKLKAQRDEVVALRQEIGIIRQVYTDFVGQTRTMILDLKSQTSRVQALAATKVSSTRAFIEAGKTKLENESSELVVRGDDVQDAIDQMRSDIMNRKVRPRPAQLAEVASTLRSVNDAREQLVHWLASVKQSWKATWEEELQTICAEQQMLDSHETLLKELQDDLDEAGSVFKAVQQVADSFKHAKGRGGPGGLGNYVQPAAADDHQGLSTVMLEVKGLQPDPSKRLEAIERAEKARVSELANRKDEFADELDGFVTGAKLKKTGGVEEADRVRQARNEATLKAMFR